MIVDPPLRGTNKHTNFPIQVIAVADNFTVALVVLDDGDLCSLPLDQVNTNWRWNREKNAFDEIDLPED